MSNGTTNGNAKLNSEAHKDTYEWDVSNIIMSLPMPCAVKYAVLILNRPLTQSQAFLKRIWNNACVRITVDGGTKRWDKYWSCMSEEIQKSIKLPHMITGDFDSIGPEIKEKYKEKGCELIHTPDQNYTDFTKALMQLNSHCKKIGTQMEYVLTLVQNSGRLDQILGNIQTLFLNKEKSILNPDTKVFLLSDDAISWLLEPGMHVISIPEESRKQKKAWCSLVPIGEPCLAATTTGLKWNLTNQTLKYGGLVSTSNTFDGSKTVTVKCSSTLLWSMKIAGIMDPL